MPNIPELPSGHVSLECLDRAVRAHVVYSLMIDPPPFPGVATHRSSFVAIGNCPPQALRFLASKSYEVEVRILGSAPTS